MRDRGRRESRPRDVAANRQPVRHNRAAARLSRRSSKHKAARLDQVDRDAEASRQPQQGAGILRNVGLEQGEAQMIGPGQVAQGMRRSAAL